MIFRFFNAGPIATSPAPSKLKKIVSSKSTGQMMTFGDRLVLYIWVWHNKNAQNIFVF